MSCLDVLYQPYSSQVYHGKHSALRPHKYGHSYEAMASNSVSNSGSVSLNSPGVFEPSRPKSPRSDAGQSGPISPIRYSPIAVKRRISSASSHHNSEELSSPSYSHNDKQQPAQLPSCQMQLQATNERASSQSHTDNVFYNNATYKSSDQTASKSQKNTDQSNVNSYAIGDTCNVSRSAEERSSCRLKKQKSPPIHRVSSRCVMFNYFDGNTVDEVDEHFSRALNQDSKSPQKDPPASMSKRNFPPSFWNSDYQHPVSSAVNQTRDGSRNMMFSFTPGSSLPTLLPTHQQQYAQLGRRFSASTLDLAPKFDPYQSSCAFTGFQDHFNQTVSAAAAAAVASRGVRDPWNPYAGLSTSLTGQNLYSHRAMTAAAAAAASAVPDLYGLSAAAVAAAASHSLDQRYNSLLMSTPSLKSSNVLSASLACRANDINKDPASLWPVARYSGFRF